MAVRHLHTLHHILYTIHLRNKSCKEINSDNSSKKTYTYLGTGGSYSGYDEYIVCAGHRHDVSVYNSITVSNATYYSIFAISIPVGDRRNTVNAWLVTPSNPSDTVNISISISGGVIGVK